MTLEEKVNWTNKIANGISLVAHTLLADWNETEQYLAKVKEIPYETYMGYLSDYAATPIFSSILFLITKPSSVVPFFYAAILTAVEFTHGGNLFTSNGTFDLLDIPCYWLGAGVAHGIHKATGGK